MHRKKFMLFITSIFFLYPFVYGRIINIAHQDEFNTVLNNNNVVVAKFFTPECFYCKIAQKPFEELSEQYATVTNAFVQADVNQFPELLTAYDTEFVPTFFLFKQGKQLRKSSDLTIIKQALEQITNGKELTAHESTTQTIISNIIEFLLKPIHFIRNVWHTIFAKITQFFNW